LEVEVWLLGGIEMALTWEGMSVRREGWKEGGVSGERNVRREECQEGGVSGGRSVRREESQEGVLP